MADMTPTDVKYLNDMLDQRVATGMAATREWLEIWQDGLNYVYDDQLSGKKRDKGWDRIQANFLHPTVMQALALDAERRRGILAVPADAVDVEGAEFHQRLLAYQFEYLLDLPMLSLRAALDGHVYGMYVGKVFWNPWHDWDAEAHRWAGAPEISLARPMYFGADPEAETLEGAEYVYCRRQVSVSWAQARWPKFRNQIAQAAEAEPDDYWADMTSKFAAYEDQADPGVRGLGTEGAIARLLGARTRGRERVPSRDGTSRASSVIIEEVFWRDRESFRNWDTEKIPYGELAQQGRATKRLGVPVQPKTGQVFRDENWPTRVKGKEWDEPRYPRGRYVIRIGEVGKQIILNPNIAQQVWKYRHWPYTVGVNGLLPHAWQGLNSVAMPKGMQDWINLTMSMMAAQVKWFGHPALMVEDDAVSGAAQGDNLASKLRRVPGAIWKLVRGGIDRIKPFEPPEMPRSTLEFFDLVGKQLRDLAGMQQIALGHEGKAKTASEAIELLRESHRRSGLQSLLLDRWVLRLAEQVTELNQDRLEEGQQIRLAAEQQRPLIPPKSLSIFRRVLGLYKVPGTEDILAELQTINEQQTAAVAVPSSAFDARFDLRLEVGADLPHDLDQQQKKESTLAMFQALATVLPQAAVAVLPQLLRAHDIDDADQIADEVKMALEQQQAAQEAAAQQAAQRPQPATAASSG